MCPPADAPIANGNEEMVPIDTDDAPHIPPPASNGESVPPPVKSHKGLYARPSDFLSNTSNWKVRGSCLLVLAMHCADIFQIIESTLRGMRDCMRHDL